MSRLPMKMESQRQQGGPVHIQGVRFVKPRLRFRYVANIGLEVETVLIGSAAGPLSYILSPAISLGKRTVGSF